MLIIKVIPVKTLVKFSLGELYIGKKKPLEEIADAVDDVEEEDDEE